MYRTLTSVLFIASLSGVFSAAPSISQVERGAPQENGCVRCHSRLATADELGARFLDWRASRHAAAGVTCDKCHGGDAAAPDRAKAHAGMLPPGEGTSRTSRMNAPETCGACHHGVVSSFVESEHYRLLKAREVSVSCTSCHGHMGSSVSRGPFECESLCTSCHNTIQGPSPRRPDIVRRAKSTLDTFARTDYLISWINQLLEQAEKKKLNMVAEMEDYRLLKLTLAEAKTSWHAFSLASSSAKAAKSFDDAVAVKDRLSKKLGL